MQTEPPALAAGGVQAIYRDRGAILLSARQLALALGCEKSLVNRAARRGDLRAVRISPGRVGYSATSVVAWLTNRDEGEAS